MKRLTLIIIGVLLCTPLYSDMNPYIYGVAGAPSGCSSETLDQEYDGSADFGVHSGVDTRWQSFQVGSSGKISSIEIYCIEASGTENIEMRWGTGTDLSSSYSGRETVSVSTTGWTKFTFETKGDVSTGTTYYFAIQGEEASYIIFGGDNTSSSYSGGNYFFGTSSWGIGTTFANRDMLFRVNLCAD